MPPRYTSVPSSYYRSESKTHSAASSCSSRKPGSRNRETWSSTVGADDQECRSWYKGNIGNAFQREAASAS